MAELADAPGLGPGPHGDGGSSPLARTHEICTDPHADAVAAIASSSNNPKNNSMSWQDIGPDRHGRPRTRYNRAMEALARISTEIDDEERLARARGSYNSSQLRTKGDSDTSGVSGLGPGRPRGQLRQLRPTPNDLKQHPVITSRGTSTRARSSSAQDRQALVGLAALDAPPVVNQRAPRAMKALARLMGLLDTKKKDPRVEANARLTATTGLLLLVLFFFEGLTIPFIVRLVSWHIVIGLVIIPPVLLKTCSTLWKFTHYYLGDPAYVRAGPPHPLLRALGPLVMISTLVLLASGVALWLAGPQAHLLFRIHQLTFFAWLAILAVHVGSHLVRALRLAAADERDARLQAYSEGTSRHSAAAKMARATSRPSLMGARIRRSAVAASLVLGLGLGFLGKTVSTAWTTPATPSHPTTIVSGRASNVH